MTRIPSSKIVTSALVLGPGGVGLVSVIDQFVLLMLQLFAFAVPFTAVKVLSKAHSESIESFKATYAGLLRLLLILGSIGAAVGMALFVLGPGWLSVSTCWIQMLPSLSARMRDVASLALPAAESTTMLTGFDG